MADIPIQWKKISRGIPRVRKFADDRAPTIDEIQKITEYPDRRIKAIVCTMASSGIRVGAWDHLKWKHIIPIERNGLVINLGGKNELNICGIHYRMAVGYALHPYNQTLKNN